MARVELQAADLAHTGTAASTLEVEVAIALGPQLIDAINIPALTGNGECDDLLRLPTLHIDVPDSTQRIQHQRVEAVGHPDGIPDEIGRAVLHFIEKARSRSLSERGVELRVIVQRRLI